MRRGNGVPRWTIGVTDVGAGDGVLALTLDEARRAEAAGASVARFDEVLAGAEVAPADGVLVHPSMWRGHSFIALCEWIVCAKLARPGSRVVWAAPARGGATGVRKVLEARGWEFTEAKEKGRRRRIFEGRAPQPGPMPAPRSFLATLGGRELSFEADWGAFSLGHVDDGTQRLFDAANARGAASVADIGTGYGAVAIGLCATASAGHAIGSDVDLVALYLARRNADANGAQIELVCDDDPSALDPTELTTCEIPTHVAPAQTERLVRGLTARAEKGVVLVAVHMGIAQRYASMFAGAGARVRVEDGDTHAIIELGSRSS